MKKCHVFLISILIPEFHFQIFQDPSGSIFDVVEPTGSGSKNPVGGESGQEQVLKAPNFD